MKTVSSLSFLPNSVSKQNSNHNYYVYILIKMMASGSYYLILIFLCIKLPVTWKDLLHISQTKRTHDVLLWSVPCCSGQRVVCLRGGIMSRSIRLFDFGDYIFQPHGHCHTENWKGKESIFAPPSSAPPHLITLHFVLAVDRWCSLGSTDLLAPNIYDLKTQTETELTQWHNLTSSGCPPVPVTSTK
jgi:hypothetical protein